MGRREKWPEKVGRREKAGRKCREEGENRMLWEKGDIDEKVILLFFFKLRNNKGWGMGKLTYTVISLVLVGRNRESMESNLSHLRLPGLEIGDGQHTSHALGRNLIFRASL